MLGVTGMDLGDQVRRHDILPCSTVSLPACPRPTAVSIRQTSNGRRVSAENMATDELSKICCAAVRLNFPLVPAQPPCYETAQQ